MTCLIAIERRPSSSGRSFEAHGGVLLMLMACAVSVMRVCDDSGRLILLVVTEHNVHVVPGKITRYLGRHGKWNRSSCQGLAVITDTPSLQKCRDQREQT